MFETHWHRAARRGANVAKMMALRPGAHAKRIAKIQRRVRKSARLRRALRSETNPTAKLEIRRSISKNKQKHDEHVRALCEEVVRSVRAGKYRFDLELGAVIAGKQTFQLAGDAPESFFVSKTVQATLANTFHIHPTSRTAAADLVCSVLSDRMPKNVVRFDLKSFYESVPHSKLLKLLRQQARLPSFTVDIVSDLLRQYADLTGQKAREAHGLPRGVGVSAYLAETYLTQLDIEIRTAFRHCTYVRYVDDVFISMPDYGGATSAWRNLERANRIVESLGLRVGRDPDRLLCKYLEVDPASATKFGFLGYEYEYSNLPLTVRLSSGRLDKIIKRVELATEAYLRSYSPHGKSAKVLLDRVRLLTANTRLSNSKSFAFVGIYFSNRHLTDMQQLKDLDVKVQALLDRVPDAKLRARLASCNFEHGFGARTFIRRSPMELKVLTSVWK